MNRTVDRSAEPRPVKWESLPEFLTSVPGLDGKLERMRRSEVKHADKDREAVRLLLHDPVRELLVMPKGAAGDAGATWASELVEFNYSDRGTNNVDFVTNLLVDHAIQRPWIIETPYMDSVTHNIRKQTMWREFRVAGLCEYHHDCNSLSSIIRRHGSRVKELRWNTGLPNELSIEWHSVELPRLDLERQPKVQDIAYHIDCHVGIAGIIPSRQRDSSKEQQRREKQRSEAGLQQEFLREFQHHVKFEQLPGVAPSYRARITFQSEQDVLRPKDCEINGKRVRPLVKRIMGMTNQLQKAILECQSNGRCLNGIQLCCSAESSLDEPEDQVVALQVLYTSDLETLFKALQRLQQTCFSSETNMQLPILFAGTGMFSAFVTNTSYVAGLIPVVAGALFYRNRNVQAKKLTEEIRRVKMALGPVFRSLGIKFEDLRQSKSAADILHYSSLALQCVSLALQSSVRGLISPMGFSFLEDDVSEFVLEGTKMGPKVYAVTQPLTCLGGMLGDGILVFRKSPPVELVPLDVVASLKDVISLWGPGEIITQRFSDNNVLPYGITKISIGGGTLSPLGKVKNSFSLWHWEAVDTCIDVESLGQQISEGLSGDLDLKIRIGASDTESLGHSSPNSSTSIATQDNAFPGPFTPIGLGTSNRHCIHANEISDGLRRRAMLRYMKDIGTHGEYYEASNKDVGLQIGANVVLQTKRRYNRVSGRSVKDELTDETQSPSELITKLDQICGLFVSSCTKVMARARLRDLIAFAGPIFHPELFPLIAGQTQETSTENIIEALRGTSQLYDWAITQIEETGTTLSNSAKFKSLILGVLRRLRATGIRPVDNFEIAWLSPGQSPKAILVSCARSPWLRLFRDGTFTTTFACITPVCIESRMHNCSNAPEQSPACSFSEGFSSFTISTCLAPYCALAGRRASPRQPEASTDLSLEVGKSYLFNSESADIVATISQELLAGYLVKVKVTGVKGILKRLVARGEALMVREENHSDASPCLINNGGLDANH